MNIKKYDEEKPTTKIYLEFCNVEDVAENGDHAKFLRGTVPGDVDNETLEQYIRAGFAKGFDTCEVEFVTTAILRFCRED